MRDSLYFDTARLGQVTPRAKKALCELLRYSWGHGSAADYEDLLVGGYDCWPAELANDYPDLNIWPGLEALKTKLIDYTGAHADSRVVFANRSSQLMKFASHLLFGPCKNVLITDCTWPSYESTLRRNLGHAGRKITKLRVRKALLETQLTKQELVDRIVQAFVLSKCDGLFLPAIDNLGVAFPVQEIVEAISSVAELRFVVVDGAQAFSQSSIELQKDFCDFFLTGCHKWLGGYLPMGLGFYGHRRSAGYIETRLEQAISRGFIEDPLLLLSEELLSGNASAFGETVNLAPLFSCAGALHDKQATTDGFRERKRNMRLCELTLQDPTCRILNRNSELRASVLLLQLQHPDLRRVSGATLSKQLAARGVIATCYDNGMIRLAMPGRPLGGDDLAKFERAIRSVSKEQRLHLGVEA